MVGYRVQDIPFLYFRPFSFELFDAGLLRRAPSKPLSAAAFANLCCQANKRLSPPSTPGPPPLDETHGGPSGLTVIATVCMRRLTKSVASKFQLAYDVSANALRLKIGAPAGLLSFLGLSSKRCLVDAPGAPRVSRPSAAETVPFVRCRPEQSTK